MCYDSFCIGMYVCMYVCIYVCMYVGSVVSQIPYILMHIAVIKSSLALCFMLFDRLDILTPGLLRT